MRTIETPSAGHVLGRATELADELGRVAGEVDDGRRAAEHGYRAVRDAGLLALLIPREAGGAGLSFLDYTKVLEALAVGDGSTALGFNMHNVAIGSLCESATHRLPPAAAHFRDWVFREVVDDGKLFASATSEVDSGAKLSGIKASYRRTGDGFVLNGRKSFVSLAGIADYYIATARAQDAATTAEVSHFVLSKDDEGVSFEGQWDGAALAGTATAAMSMTDVRLPRSRLFLGVEGMSLFKLVREPHWMVAGYVGAYLGIAESILRHVVEFVTNDSGRRASATTQASVGRLAVEVAAARALVYHAAGTIADRKGSVEANTAVHAAKYVIGDLAPRLAYEAVRICGSSALHRSHPLQRLLREAPFCSVMPAKPDECLEYVGKAALGFNMFDANTIQW